MKSRRRVVAWGIVALGLAAGRADATPLDPSSPLYTAYSQGSVTLASGSYVFNLGTAAPTLSFYDGPIFTVVATGFVTAEGINVFDFQSLTVEAGAILTVNQSSASGPIALLSSTSIVMAGSINVSPNNGIFSGLGGPGAANLGNGANGGATSAPGSSGGPGSIIVSGGGGGGFGGAGQQGGGSPIFSQITQQQVGTLQGGLGGGAYANLAGVLKGGSRGGFGGNPVGGAINPGSGGFGGGAIELGAIGAVTISGSINANGSSGFSGNGPSGGGGGGSGGGVLIHGNSVAITGTISAVGGAGGGGYGVRAYGGQGGGGQVVALYDDRNGGTFTNSGTVNVGSGATAGQAYAIPLSTVPEPASALLLGVGAIGGAGWASARRRRG